MLAYLPSIFLLSLAAMLLLVVICHVAPERLVPWNSVPWAFQLRRAPDTELHGVLYAAFHGTRLGQWSHLFFLVDVLCWFVVLWACHPALLALQLAALLVLAFRVRDRLLGALLLLLWGGCAALAPWIAARLHNAVPWAEGLLIANALLRFVGHVREPVPPLVAEPVDRFRRFREVRFGARLLLMPLIGYLSELAAGLPWVLIRVHVAWVADRLRRGGAWSAMVSGGRALREGGLRSHPTLAALAARAQPSIPCFRISR